MSHRMTKRLGGYTVGRVPRCYMSGRPRAARRRDAMGRYSVSRKRSIEWSEQTNGCWNLISHSLSTQGYPSIKRNEKRSNAHRFIYEECFGWVPRGMVVRHKCDNRLCINPEHLELGTQKDNTHDKSRNGTWPGGECGYHKLTWDQVKEIRAKYSKGNSISLAKEYGVCKWTIRDVVSGRRWRVPA